MLLYFSVVAAALSAALLVVLIFQLLPQQSRVVQQRIQEVKILGSHDLVARDLRQRRREKLRSVLEELGGRMQSDEQRAEHTRLQLRQAGILTRGAVAMYYGSKMLLAAALGFGTFLLVQMGGAGPFLGLVISVYMAAVGWIAPALWLRVRRVHRQKELQRALPDALDLLVVCVEAGQGLNQALIRVSEEIGHVSFAMAMELSQVNFQIRAGTPRDLALKDLSRNTGLPDIRSLVTMLIQTDRFGTSVAQALRVHADTMREKRRQRAEEAAAKTTIKLVFPLVICIFPALFVVILTPGLIEILRTLGGM